jgi:hypothetical protein
VDPQGKITTFFEIPEPPFLSMESIPLMVHMGPGDRLYADMPGATKSGNLWVGNAGKIVSWSIARGVASDERVDATEDKLQITEGEGEGLADFVVTNNGTIYALLSTGVKRIDPSGAASNALQWTKGSTIGHPSRIVLSPDQSMAVTVDQITRYGWSFQIAADGSLQNGEPFYRLETPETSDWAAEKGNPAEDADGEVYFATPLGIQVAMQNGRISQILNSPIPGGGPLTAITFDQIGDQNWLYVAQDGKLFRRPVKVAGANAWTIVKPPKPTL